jgi:hypothetical protein
MKPTISDEKGANLSVRNLQRLEEEFGILRRLSEPDIERY